MEPTTSNKKIFLKISHSCFGYRNPDASPVTKDGRRHLFHRKKKKRYGTTKLFFSILAGKKLHFIQFNILHLSALRLEIVS